MAFGKKIFSYLNLFGFGLENQCPKAPRNGSKSIEHRGPGAPKSRFGGVPEGFWKVLAPKSASGRVLGGSWARLVGHKRPTWPQLGPQDGAQIESKSIKKTDLKINHFFSASWNRFLNVFWWIWGGKMEASCHPNGIQNVHYFERRFVEKSCSRCSGGSIFEILGVEVGIPRCPQGQ